MRAARDILCPRKDKSNMGGRMYESREEPMDPVRAEM